MSKAKDLTGQRFGKLVVVKRAGSKKTKGGVIRATWWCQCDCGSPLKEIKELLKQEDRVKKDIQETFDRRGAKFPKDCTSILPIFEQLNILLNNYNIINN